MRVLVVGGTGFIGRHIAHRAAELGWHVTSLSRRSPSEPLPPRVRHVVADIAEAGALQGVLGDAAFEYVVNCGGCVDHARGSGARHRETLRSMVTIGSSDEYGNNPAPQQEGQREAPITPYSQAKVAATHFLHMLYRTESFPATILRLFITYSPGQDTARFLPQVIRGCLEGGPFPTSEGRQLRDFCFVSDAVFAALMIPAAQGEVINIGSGQPVSIRQVVESVQRLIARGEPRFGEIPYRPGENMALYASASKARALLDWIPRVPLEDGLQRTIQWLRNRT